MQRAFLTITWTTGEQDIAGPYPTAAAARQALADSDAPIDHCAVIGPVPIEYMGDGDAEIAAVKRTWAVFETAEDNLEFIMSTGEANDEAAAAFDSQPGIPGEFIWCGNYQGATPADAYREANESRRCEEGKQYVAIPVGVFGPTDWMRAAGEVLSGVQ